MTGTFTNLHLAIYGTVHLVLGLTVWCLLNGADSETFMMYTPVSFFVQGQDVWDETGPIGLLSLLGIVLAYGAAAVLPVWAFYYSRLSGDIQLTRATLRFCAVADAFVFLALAPFLGMTDLYEMMAGAAVSFAATWLLASYAEDPSKSSKFVPAWAALLAMGPYALGLANIVEHRVADVGGGPAETHQEVGAWMGLGFKALCLVGSTAWVLMSNSGYESVGESGTHADVKAGKLVMVVLAFSGLGAALGLFFMHADWEVYSPLYWTIGKVHVRTWDFPAYSLVVAAWALLLVGYLADWLGTVMCTNVTLFRNLDVAQAVTFALITAMVSAVAAVLSGVQGLVEVIELSAFGAAGAMIAHFENRAKAYFTAFFGILLSCAPFALSLAKLTSGEDEEGALVLVILWLVLYAAMGFADMWTVASSENPHHRQIAHSFGLIAVMVVLTVSVLQFDTKAEVRAMMDAVLAGP